MIGITGGIASGKSVVSEHLRDLGAVVLDADILSKEVVLPHTPAWAKIKDVFPEVIQADLTLDRCLLGKIIFSDAAKRKVLEEIVHPEILVKLLDGARAAKQAGKVVFAEVPLLYEVGWDRYMKKVWVVSVTAETQLARLIKRAGISKVEASQMIASQMPLAEKVKLAAVVIDNNGSLAETWQQVDALWRDEY